MLKWKTWTLRKHKSSEYTHAALKMIPVFVDSSNHLFYKPQLPIFFRLMLFSDWDNLVTQCWLVAHMQEIEVIAGCIVLLKVGPTEEIWQHTSYVKNSLRCINDCVVEWCAPSSVACANYLLMLSSSYSRSNLMRSFPRELELLLGLIEKKSNCLWFHLGKSL